SKCLKQASRSQLLQLARRVHRDRKTRKTVRRSKIYDLIVCFLAPRHRLARKIWSQKHLQWDDELKRVLFIDESRFCMDFNDGRLRVRRLPSERFIDTIFLLLRSGFAWLASLKGDLEWLKFVEADHFLPSAYETHPVGNAPTTYS
ncbi:MAG: hypothetical protein AAGK05_15390, partial [Pseudomonadota bacterium]